MDSPVFRTLTGVSVACLLILPHPPVSAAGLRDEAVKSRQEGFERRRSGDFAGAFEAYQKAVILDPTDAIAHTELGRLYEQRGEEDAAKQSYLRALVVDPNHVDALANLAALQQRAGRNDQALPYWLKLGLLHEQGGELDAAKQSYEQILEIDPNHPEALSHLAMLQERLGNKEQALVHWLKLGLLAEQRGDVESARQAYLRALVIDPNEVDALSNLAMLQERLGNKEQALMQWLKLGLLAEQRGDFEAAKRADERAMGLEPNAVEANVQLAALYERMGKQNEAIAYWKKVSQLGHANDPWTLRAQDRLMALGAVKSGRSYHRHVLEHELEAHDQSLEEFRDVTERRQQP